MDIRSVLPEVGWFEALREAIATDTEMAVIRRWCTLNLAIVLELARKHAAEVGP